MNQKNRIMIPILDPQVSDIWVPPSGNCGNSSTSVQIVQKPRATGAHLALSLVTVNAETISIGARGFFFRLVIL